MGLFTRTVLLIALVFISILIGNGLSQLSSDEPTAIDRLVAARNTRRALAARAAFLHGGMVLANVQSEYKSPDSTGGSPDQSLETYLSSDDTSEGAASLHKHYMEQIAAATAAKKNALKTGTETVEGLRTQVAVNERGIIAETMKFNSMTSDMALFAQQVRPYADGLTEQALNTINMQESLATLLDEQMNLDAEKKNLENLRVRADANAAGLESQLAALEREHIRVSELISRYDRADPKIAAKVDRAGTPWVEGVVTWAGSDSRAGQMMISIGEADGLQAGQVLSIQRQGRFIGRARVQSLERNSALLRLEEQFLGNVLPMADDTVTGAPNLGGMTD